MNSPGKVRAGLLQRQQGRCFYCGFRLPEEEATIEHLEPKACGGSNAQENLAVCCRAFNKHLGAMPYAFKQRWVEAVRSHPRSPKAGRCLAPVATDMSLRVRALAAKMSRQLARCPENYRPKRQDRLRNWIASLLSQNGHSPQEADGVLQWLSAHGSIQIGPDARLHYRLPPRDGGAQKRPAPRSKANRPEREANAVAQNRVSDFRD